MGRDATEEFEMLHDDEVIPKYAPEIVIGRVKELRPALRVGEVATREAEHAAVVLEARGVRARLPPLLLGEDHDRGRPRGVLREQHCSCDGGDVRECRLAKFRQNVARFRLYRLRFLQEKIHQRFAQEGYTW